MNQIVKFDATSGIVICQAGVILGKLDAYLAERGFTVPLDLGAKGRQILLLFPFFFFEMKHNV